MTQQSPQKQDQTEEESMELLDRILEIRSWIKMAEEIMEIEFHDNDKPHYRMFSDPWRDNDETNQVISLLLQANMQKEIDAAKAEVKRLLGHWSEDPE